MDTAETISLWQTVGVWVAVVVAPGTVWAMFRQTQLAREIAESARRRECLERLVGFYEPRCLMSGRDFYRELNVVPILFPSEGRVLEAYRRFRDVAVLRDDERRMQAYEALVMTIAAACSVPLGEPDLKAVFAPQFYPAKQG
jgi:hypothetical protein